MAKTPLSEQPTEAIRARLSAIRKVHFAIAAIFAVIILAWIVGGYWRQNLPIFLSTVAMAVGVTGMQFAIQGGLVAELRRRERQG